MDSIDALEHVSDLDNRVLESDQVRAKRPLNLYAVAEGPKLQLLWATFQFLNKEAGTKFYIIFFFLNF